MRQLLVLFRVSNRTQCSYFPKSQKPGNGGVSALPVRNQKSLTGSRLWFSGVASSPPAPASFLTQRAKEMHLNASLNSAPVSGTQCYFVCISSVGKEHILVLVQMAREDSGAEFLLREGILALQILEVYCQSFAVLGGRNCVSYK